MRVFTASLATETNTFSPIPTDRASLRRRFTRGRAGIRMRRRCARRPIVALRRSNEPTFRNTVRQHFAV